MVGAEYYVCRIQLFELNYKGLILVCKMTHQSTVDLIPQNSSESPASMVVWWQADLHLYHLIQNNLN